MTDSHTPARWWAGCSRPPHDLVVEDPPAIEPGQRGTVVAVRALVGAPGWVHSTGLARVGACGRAAVQAGGMLSVRDRLVAEFEGRVGPPVVAGVVARCGEQLRGQGLPEAALPELVERLARADLVEFLAGRANRAAHRGARPAPADR